MVIRYPLIAFALAAASAGAASAQDPQPFLPPKAEPAIVTPGSTNANPPSDALVLFDGKDLSHWHSADGGPAKWNVRDGYVEVAAGMGAITTKEQFGDVQL
ncbi:MAG TPA: family 16 glycoside hydrolase, partial [Gemmatimonadaceae bacterium]